MHSESLLFTMFLIFAGSALVATGVLFARQALMVGYIVVGLLVGPSLLGWVTDTHGVQQIADIGIMFLLFLLGLNLPTSKLLNMMRESTLITVGSALLFVLVGGGVCHILGYSAAESFLIGSCLVFSSTIIGLKLLPTTVLHHKHTGEVIISILLLQDILAIALLIVIEVMGSKGQPVPEMLMPLVTLPLVFFVAFAAARWMLFPLMRRFDKIQEYLFLLAIGWCLGMAELAEFSGLMREMGAFVAGVALASHPVSMFLSDRLRPLRDFFLVMFFFSIGAGFDLTAAGEVIWLAILLAVLILSLKPVIYAAIMLYSGEGKDMATEVGVRLGQASEFSLLVAVLALNKGVIGANAAMLIQAATILTFLVSPYLIVMNYPTPMAVSDKLRRD